MKMIQPNRYKQAVQELATIDLGSFVIPDEIQENGSKNHYYCIGVKARDSKDGFTKLYSCKKLSCDINQWNKMGRQVKQGVFKQPFADIYDKIIILHNPTDKPKAKKEAPKKLSPSIKGKIKKLVAEGKNSTDIAEELKADIGLVREYINKLNK